MPFTFKLSRRWARLRWAPLALLLPLACVSGDKLVTPEQPPEAPQPAVVRLRITPSDATVQSGQSVDFTAIGLTASGDTAPVAVQWFAKRGTVTESGDSKPGKRKGHYKSPGQSGSDTVIVTDGGGLADTATVVVTDIAVETVSVSPSSGQVAVGETLQLTAQALDAQGNPLSGRSVAWSSNASNIASVSDNGVVTGVGAGSVTITATVEGKSGIATISVTQVPVASVTVSPSSATVEVGKTVQLAAIAKDGNGNTLSGRSVSWRTSASSVASVSSSGIVTGVGAGSATITATIEGKSGTAAITVTTVPVASVTVSPASASIEISKTVQLSAVAKDGSGNTLTGRSAAWTTSASSVATVSSNGLVTGVGAGSATITATIEGKSGTAAITVTIVPVASVTVTPASANVQVGQSVQLSAVAKDANGNTLSGRTVSWNSNASGIASVSTNGLVTGEAAGSATITATVEGKSGSSSITVTAPPPPPPPGSTVVLVGAGDIADCGNDNDEATARLLDNIQGTVFTAGDNAYPDGTASNFADCYDPTWGRHKNRTRPAPGNHDYHTSGASAYYDYFGASAGANRTGYYSYDLGDWHVVSLNSEISMSAGSAQETWLRSDLAATTKRCVAAYWHKPRYSSGSHGSSTGSRPLWQALYDAGAEIVLVGHDHNYERFAPQDANANADANGIREFVVGTGGAGLRSIGTAEPNSEVRYSGGHGVLKLTLSSSGYTWEFISVAGKSFTDSGSASCH